MKLEEHKARHEELHRALDELVADFIEQKPNGEYLPSKVSIMKLIEWSHSQTLNPTGEKDG